MEEDPVRKEGPSQAWKEPDCLNIHIGLWIIPQGSAFDREGFFFRWLEWGERAPFMPKSAEYQNISLYFCIINLLFQQL